MERVAESEVRFLLALNASEESALAELKADLLRWNCTGIDVTALLLALIHDGTVLLMERQLDSITHYAAQESVALAAGWATSASRSTCLFLTESGWKRWRTDDWGITTERAQYLMFSQQPGGATLVR
jgi:hypothetical protein